MKRPALVLLLLAALASAILSAGRGTASHSFDPDAAIELSSDDTGANADITSDFAVPEGDVNFDSQITFIPGHPYAPTAGFFIAPGDDIPDGTVVGDLDMTLTLGFFNGPCRPPSLLVACALLDASLDTSDTITFDEQFEDANSNGIPDGAERYPDFLNTLFPGMTPWARMYCQHNLDGHWLSHNIVVFAPGDMPGFPVNWGYPSVVIFNDPTKPPSPYQPITDVCTPVESNNTVYGLADGAPYRANPCAPGTYTFRSYAVGLPDADGDGFENEVDTCPYHVNVGDPGEIDCACDPDPNNLCWPGSPGPVDDCDDDWFYNRGDNCPIVANPNQEDADGDGIGDACEGNVPETGAQCDNAVDDDGDTRTNDGCPSEETPETICDEDRLTCLGDPKACDDDGDTKVNDGCAAFGYGSPDATDGSQPEVVREMDVEITGPDVCPVAVGGIVEIQASGSGSAVDAAADSSGGSSVGYYGALAGAAAAGAIALTAGALYARRHWLT